MHLFFVYNNLCDALVALTLQRICSNLLLVYFSPLDHLIEPTAHIIKLKMGTRRWASVLGIRVIIEIDALVIHETTSAIILIRIFYHIPQSIDGMSLGRYFVS